MTLEDAKLFLDSYKKEELIDHAIWVNDEHETVAGGYFSNVSEVWIDSHSFEGEEADILRRHYLSASSVRNDETGPDEFNQGETISNLTLDSVRREICSKQVIHNVHMNVSNFQNSW